MEWLQTSDYTMSTAVNQFASIWSIYDAQEGSNPDSRRAKRPMSRFEKDGKIALKPIYGVISPGGLPGKALGF